MTRTYTIADIVIVGVNRKSVPTSQQEYFGQKVYVQDFSFDTDNAEAIKDCEGLLDVDHIRTFKSMHDASVFMLEQGAVVGRCIMKRRT